MQLQRILCFDMVFITLLLKSNIYDITAGSARPPHIKISGCAPEPYGTKSFFESLWSLTCLRDSTLFMKGEIPLLWSLMPVARSQVFNKNNERWEVISSTSNLEDGGMPLIGYPLLHHSILLQIPSLFERSLTHLQPWDTECRKAWGAR
jgi:hypothetical protein